MELKGKIIDFLGDSITEGNGVKNRQENRFDNRMKKLYGLAEVHNYGIGGTRIAHQTKASAKPRHDLCFCGRVYDIDKNADIVLVYGGINDYLHGDAPVGKIGDTTPDTFCGGVWFLMNYLKKEFPGKTIVFATPAHSAHHGYACDETKPSDHQNKLPDAQPVLFYVDTIIELGKQFGIPVIDLYRSMPIIPSIPEMEAKYTSDGLHFNDEGHRILAETFGAFLQQL